MVPPLIAHNKIMVIDRAMAITRSFNFRQRSNTTQRTFS
jgi:phosphatidylserine/phosphatidylglycerophosphate/cardiolipin synthase-like enzyme